MKYNMNKKTSPQIVISNEIQKLEQRHFFDQTPEVHLDNQDIELLDQNEDEDILQAEPLAFNPGESS